MPIKIDYTPVGALSTLAQKAGRVEGVRRREQLKLQQAQDRRAEEELSRRIQRDQIGRQIIQDRYNQALERGDAETARRIAQQEFENINLEKEQATEAEAYRDKRDWLEDEPTRKLAEAKAEQERKREDFKWRYSEEDKRKKEQLQRAISGVRLRVAEQELTAEQGENLEKQLWMVDNSILPSMVNEPTPNPVAEFEKYKMTNDDGSYSYINQKTGKIELDPYAEMANEKAEAEAKAATDKADVEAKKVIEKSKLVIKLLDEAKSFEEATILADKLFGDYKSEDQQALEWAEQNPDDPRAIKIMQLLVGK